MPIYKMDGKKDGKQKYRVRINYMDNLGNAKQIDRVAYGADAAKQLEMELNYQIKQQDISKKITIGQLFAEYLEMKKHEVRETSLDKTNRILQRYVIPKFENTRIDKITIPLVQKWKCELSEQKISITTRKNIYGEFRALMSFAVKMEYIPKNTVAAAGNFKSPLEPAKEMLYYTAEEFKKYISAAREYAEKSEANGNLYNWNYYVFFSFAFFTGMRKGEIYALTWHDIKDGYISITKSIAQKLKGGDRITPPKNKSSIREIQIPLPLQKAIDEHYKRCSVMDGFNDNLYICGGDRPIRDTSLNNINTKFADLAGVKHIRIHDFRHSHASLLANEGINIQEIARRLGHSKISITWETYSHLYPREEERAINILNKIV